jgi:hypothetical protein
MSLIETVGVRNFSDIINEGSRATYTGTITGPKTDEIVTPVPDDRFLIVVSYIFTSPTVAPDLVSFGLRGGVPASTMDLFEGYVGSGNQVHHHYSPGDWRYGELGWDLVMSVPAGLDVAYTFNCRISSSPEPLGYIQQIGSKEHANPYFGPESGRERGQSEL